MTEIGVFAVAVVAAYLSGALPFSLLAARVFGLPDPRTFGSGNPGATNIARRHKTAALLTLLGDIAKGWLPAAAAMHFLGEEKIGLTAAVGIAAVAGHVFSIFLRFRGGKGVATALGVFLGWHWPIAAAAAAMWALMFACFRISSLASLSAMAAAVVALLLLSPPPLVLAGAVITAAVAARHRQNIAALLRRQENQFGGKK